MVHRILLVMMCVTLALFGHNMTTNLNFENFTIKLITKKTN